MIIERVLLRLIRLTLNEPFRISSGTEYERRILLVRLDSDGAVGWGECVAPDAPNYAYETVDMAFGMMKDYLVPAMVREPFGSPQQVAVWLEGVIRGHRMAKAALEMAAWDLAAKMEGVSLSSMLGGVKSEVATGVSIGLQAGIGQLNERIAGFLEEGYQRIKLKIAPGWDLEMVKKVRETFPDIMLTVDANAAYAPEDADRLARFDSYDLAMIEQPFADDELLEHAELQRRIRTAVCLDESITSPARCRQALYLRSGRIINIKPGRVGGLTASKRIHDMCEEAHVPVWCGGMLESGIGRAHNIALASLPNFKFPGDTSASRRYWRRDIVTPAFELTRHGTIAVPTGPGIGVEVDEDYLTSIEETQLEFR